MTRLITELGCLGINLNSMLVDLGDTYEVVLGRYNRKDLQGRIVCVSKTWKPADFIVNYGHPGEKCILGTYVPNPMTALTLESDSLAGTVTNVTPHYEDNEIVKITGLFKPLMPSVIDGIISGDNLAFGHAGYINHSSKVDGVENCELNPVRWNLTRDPNKDVN